MTLSKLVYFTDWMHDCHFLNFLGKIRMEYFPNWCKHQNTIRECFIHSIVK